MVKITFVTTPFGMPIFRYPENNQLFHSNCTNHAPLFYHFEPTLSKYEETWCVMLCCCMMIKQSTFAEKCCDIEMIIAWDRSGVPRSAKMPHSLENTDSKYVAAARFQQMPLCLVQKGGQYPKYLPA